MLERLKQKLEIKSDLDFFLIMVVFSLAGSSIVFLRAPIFALFGIDAATPLWVKVLTYIPLIFVSYQINLLVFGFLLGQFEFFWKKEKKLLQLLARLFLLKKRTALDR